MNKYYFIKNSLLIKFEIFNAIITYIYTTYIRAHNIMITKRISSLQWLANKKVYAYIKKVDNRRNLFAYIYIYIYIHKK